MQYLITSVVAKSTDHELNSSLPNLKTEFTVLQVFCRQFSRLFFQGTLKATFATKSHCVTTGAIRNSTIKNVSSEAISRFLQQNCDCHNEHN